VVVFKSILVIGPTGAGKSPLGDYIAETGFRDARCGHFDFGENLRRAAENPQRFPALDDAEVRIIRSVLDTGALLEDHQFPLVEKLFSAFVANIGLCATDWVLLNGMPRHVGQAAAIRRFADIRIVANLVCDEAMVLARIRTNAGGDRTGRNDDDSAAVKKKLAIFRERTLPLLEYYRGISGVTVTDIPVDLSTRPEKIVQCLS
jgi:adenylate kinase family enzyme